MVANCTHISVATTQDCPGLGALRHMFTDGSPRTYLCVYLCVFILHYLCEHSAASDLTTRTEGSHLHACQSTVVQLSNVVQEMNDHFEDAC